ncbi:MAG: SprB repeat-containing protein [Saprospiraceae bacterium]|nr:SprB repeat-containing protein [Saprospiraceae bacterium]
MIINRQHYNPHGSSTGKIEIKGSGGTGSLVYRINSGSFQTQSTFTNLQKGRYSLEIKDVNGCLLKDSFFISEPLPITTQLTFLNSITCFGDKNAEISVNTSGGTVPFSYILDGMAGQHSSIFSGLIAGDHVIITNDKNNCADTLAFYISTPPAIELNEILKVLPDCTQNNGKITVSAIGEAQVIGTELEIFNTIPENLIIWVKETIHSSLLMKENAVLLFKSILLKILIYPLFWIPF